MLRTIECLSRYEVERQFFVREPYALISIRRPGNRFVKPLCKHRCLECCHLMLHEWDVDVDDGRCRIVKLSVRQSLKLVEFALRNRDCCSRVIIQSEEPSSQLTAISETLAAWLDIPLLRSSDWKAADADATTTLQMAISGHQLMQSF